jgi:hypothetical protein
VIFEGLVAWHIGPADVVPHHAGRTEQTRRDVYDTPRAALEALSDDTLFERLAVKVLRARYPALRITGPSGDLGRDGFGRRLFGEHDELVLLVSCENAWTAKLKRDLKPYEAISAEVRPTKAIFVTNRSTKQTTQRKYKTDVHDRLGITLEIVDLNELAVDLESDQMHSIAENDLGVCPRIPRVLQAPVAFWDTYMLQVPGGDAPLIGRDGELLALRAALDPSRDTSSRIVVVEGAGGVGKTRLAVHVAHQVATTFIAPTGTAVSRDSLVDLQIDEPSILVVDNAHRCSDLSGLAAMFNDRRFDGVQVLLTVRPGFATRVLADMGQERAPQVTVAVNELSDAAIDTIVVNRGITNIPFRRHVIDMAGGNPLLAHTACHVATENGQYTWADTTELLNKLVDNRLQSPSLSSDKHRAAVIALALMSSVRDGEDLAVMAGAVTALPAEPHRLDSVLEDLTDAGIVAGPPYALRPDTVGPAAVASALAPSSRVRVNVRRVLRALGEQAVSWSALDIGSADRRLLGISSQMIDAAGNPRGMNASRLAAQFAVLAQAAEHHHDRQVLEMLCVAVRELLPTDGDAVAWWDLMVLATHVAPFCPRLLDDLREALHGQWPLKSMPWVMDLDAGRRRRSEVEVFLTRAAELAKHVAPIDPNRAVGWLMDCAWLAFPTLGTAALKIAADGVKLMAAPRLHSTNEVWNQVFQRRERVLDALLRWGRDRRARDLRPRQHAEQDAGCPPSVTAHALLLGLAPFLSVVTTDLAVASPGDPNTLVWTDYTLLDDGRRSATLTRAVEAIGALFEQVDLRDRASRDFLLTVARLPSDLRGEAARGLSNGAPLPVDAVEVLTATATSLGRMLLSRWDDLSLAVRYAAVQATAWPRRPWRTLEQLVGDGDSVSAAALADEDVARLLVIMPISREHQWATSAAQDADSSARQYRHEAEQLGRQLPLAQSVTLLRAIDTPPPGQLALDCVGAFARAAGQAAQDADAVLAELESAPFTGDRALLAGALDSHPAATASWLISTVSLTHRAVLALHVADQLDPEHELDLLDKIHALITSDNEASATGNAAISGHGDAVSTESSVPAEQSRRYTVTRELAHHLAWCREPVIDRLARLVAIGLHGPSAALPTVLTAADQILNDRPGQGSITSLDSARTIRRDLVRMLGTALAEHDDGLAADVPYDVAHAAVGLSSWAPEDVADLLVARANDGRAPLIPPSWDDLLTTLPTRVRVPLADAFQRKVEQMVATAAMTPDAEGRALDALARLSSGMSRWDVLVVRWAGGDRDDRNRAARVLKHRWRETVWGEVIPCFSMPELTTTLLLSCVRESCPVSVISTSLRTSRTASPSFSRWHQPMAARRASSLRISCPTYMSGAIRCR